MGLFGDELNELSDDVLERIRHTGVDDGFDWDTVVQQLLVLRRIARDLDATPEDELGDAIRQNLQQAFPQVVATAQQLAAFDYAKDQNAHQTRASLVQQVAAFNSQFRETYRMHARPALPDATQLAEMRALVPELQQALNDGQAVRMDAARIQEQAVALKEQAQELIDRLTTAAGDSATHRLSTHYKEQVKRHADSAKRWIIGAGIVAVVLAVTSFVTFHGVNARKETGVEFARDAVARLLLLSILGYALSICTRGYRAQTHLAIVCQQKANALDTFVLFQETVQTDVGKEAVTVELVRTVFATSDSGYLDASSDKTIIEQQSGALTTLLAARR
jgi:hypothetical protein